MTATVRMDNLPKAQKEDQMRSKRWQDTLTQMQ